ncbi:MAG: phenylalanine--tRNA ligase subunit alpha [Bacteroidetes bacterium HGW-Bacteroidetes-19]|nr:MAG: phenylalanine--tRNA ligase subunit alpha [Bacteroidetes bacterium HGW-Bacteroidetes-20]PKP28681.1 MAG: phenylalanine--tRNA ligase subunit alpha [Bacteroidetes bacterium HGW-Bacteroidetes-19]
MSKIQQIKEELNLFVVENSEHLEQFRLQFLSKKSALQELLGEIKNVAPELRKDFGQQVNELKQFAQQMYDGYKTKIEDSVVYTKSDIDVTKPVSIQGIGSMHPVSIVLNQVCEIFEKVGFVTVSGPDIEDDWHVFSALNFPPEHPARDMQDTFFIEINPDILLRTHTSSIQVRTMVKNQPPIRVICPGRVFRNETITARSHCIFHQVEGLYIAENVSFAEMKQILLYFAKEMFGEETKIRLRPSFFPFTEPSAEMDIECKICGGKGCNVCKYSGWVEIMGCGMVDPNVLDNCGIDSKKYSGYAFGIGIERMTMLKYKTNDIRLYFENDVRFLEQFIPATK